MNGPGVGPWIKYVRLRLLWLPTRLRSSSYQFYGTLFVCYVVYYFLFCVTSKNSSVCCLGLKLKRMRYASIFSFDVPMSLSRSMVHRSDGLYLCVILEKS